jgi:hypothetical protein
MPPYDIFGRPNTLYQLPYLDFNIVLSAKFDIDETIDTGILDNPASGATPTIGGNALNITRIKTKSLLFELPSTTKTTVASLLKNKASEPLETEGDTQKKNNEKEGENNNGGTEEDSFAEGGSNESTTTISGRFVAVFPNEGLPQTLINVACEKSKEQIKSSTTTYIIKVNLINTAGEKMAYQRIEFNYDEETTFLINREDISKLYKENVISKDFKISAPIFISQEELTDQDGYAETKVDVSNSDLKHNFTVVIRINTGIISKSISL